MHTPNEFVCPCRYLPLIIRTSMKCVNNSTRPSITHVQFQFLISSVGSCIISSLLQEFFHNFCNVVLCDIERQKNKRNRKYRVMYFCAETLKSLSTQVFDLHWNVKFADIYARFLQFTVYIIHTRLEAQCPKMQICLLFICFGILIMVCFR